MLLLNLSEAGPVSTSTAASLDWMHHLQTLSTARHMSGHTLAADDSCTTAFNSMSQLHPITSPPQLTNADESPVVVEVVGSRTSLAGRVSESKSGSSAVLAVPAVLTAGQSQNEALLAEVEQLKARVQDLQVLPPPVALCLFLSTMLLCANPPPFEQTCSHRAIPSKERFEPVLVNPETCDSSGLRVWKDLESLFF